MRALALALIAAPAALLASAPAMAQDAGPYINAGVSRYSEADINATLIGGRVGYSFNPNFAVEAEGGIGVDGDRIGPVSVDIDGTLGGYGVARLPVSENVNLLARAGYQHTWASAETAGFKAEEDDGSFAIGVGAEFMFNETNGIRADYTSYTDGDDTDSVAVSYVLKF